MEFETNVQETCYNKICLWMRELFDKFPNPRQDFPRVNLFIGSALVEISVFAWGDDEAIINTRSYVVTNVDLKPDLMQFLLRENSKMRFGAFGIDEDNNIIFEHTIVGSTCDKPELAVSVKAVLKIADEYDDRIVEQWGGKRAVDRIY